MANDTWGAWLQGFNQTFFPTARKSFEQWATQRKAKQDDLQKLRKAVELEGTSSLVDNFATGRGIFSKIGVPITQLSKKQRLAILENYKGVFEGRPAAYRMVKAMIDRYPEPEQPYVPTGEETTAAEAEAWAKEAIPEPDLTSAIAEALSKGYTSGGRIKPIEERMQPVNIEQPETLSLTPEPGGLEAAMTPETRRKLAEPMPSLEVTEGRLKGYPRWMVTGGLYIPQSSKASDAIRERLINAFPKGVSEKELSSEEKNFAKWVIYGPAMFTRGQLESLPPTWTEWPNVNWTSDPRMRAQLFIHFWKLAPSDKVMRYIYDQLQQGYPVGAGQALGIEEPTGIPPLKESVREQQLKEWRDYVDALIAGKA